jgi:hypothetical protein
MAHPTPNTFTTYTLSEKEQQLGQQLSSNNIVVLQNLRASIANEKLNLPFTPNDLMSYTQQEAYLKGQLDLISHLLDLNEESQQYHHISDSQHKE